MGPPPRQGTAGAILAYRSHKSGQNRKACLFEGYGTVRERGEEGWEEGLNIFKNGSDKERKRGVIYP